MERIGTVADRVAATKAAGRDVVVVVSAMGDTTDELLTLARKITDNPARRELDMLLSAGERISMALLSMALNARGVPAVSFTGSQSGIVTNDAHTNARIVELVGLSSEEFSRIVLLPQGEFARFLRLNSNERKAVLAKLFPCTEFPGCKMKFHSVSFLRMSIMPSDGPAGGDAWRW